MSRDVGVVLLCAAAVCALGDWVAVARSMARTEHVLKPATLALLVATAAAVPLGAEKPWVIVALALGLAGDVGLLLTSDDSEPDGWFLGGLGAFLIGHGFWMAAFVRHGLSPVPAVIGVLVTLAVAVPVLGPALRSVDRDAGRTLAAVVACYSLVLGAMATLAVATGCVVVAIGGVAFLASDAILARDRFVARLPHGELAVMITYHLAQFLLLIGLWRASG